MSSEVSFNDLSFISYILFSHNSCDRCTIPDNDVDEEKVVLKVEEREEKENEDNDDLEVSDKDVDGSNDNGEEDTPNKTKAEIPKNLSFIKRVVKSDNLITLNVNRETLQESNIIRFISKKLLSKAIEMLRNLAEKDEFKNEKDNDIDDNTKEVNINKVAEIENKFFLSMPQTTPLLLRTP